MRPFFSTVTKISTFCDDFKSRLVKCNQIKSYFIFVNRNIKYISVVTLSLIHKDVLSIKSNTFFETCYFELFLDIFYRIFDGLWQLSTLSRNMHGIQR